MDFEDNSLLLVWCSVFQFPPKIWIYPVPPWLDLDAAFIHHCIA